MRIEPKLILNEAMQMTMKFAVCLEYDEQYDGYVSNVPSLPGCMSQGKTREEALESIEDAIGGYLQVLKDTGVSSAQPSDSELSPDDSDGIQQSEEKQDRQ